MLLLRLLGILFYFFVFNFSSFIMVVRDTFHNFHANATSFQSEALADLDKLRVRVYKTSETRPNTSAGILLLVYWYWYIWWHQNCFIYPWIGKLLTLSWRRFLSYRNESIDLLCISMDWFLYDNDLCHDKILLIACFRTGQRCNQSTSKIHYDTFDKNS